MATLSGKTALVTGASRGMGRSTVLKLAQQGARVVVHYGNAVAEAEEVVGLIRTAGGQADAVGADLTAPDAPHRLAAEVRKLVGDRLDILVANAGTAASVTIEDTTVADFDRLFAVNVRAPFFLVQQLLPILGEGSSVGSALLPGGACLCWHARGLCGDQGRRRHAGQALRQRLR